MATLKALLFDVDGTLADTEKEGHRIAFNQAFHEAGLDWNWTVQLYGQLLQVAGGKERIRYYIEQYLPNFSLDKPIVEFAARLHQRKTHFYLSLLQKGAIPLRSGVKRLLNEARQAGLRLGIATTTTEANVHFLLSATLGETSLKWFEVIAAGDIVSAKKPAPDIFQYALQQMQLEARHCLAFEDSENGLHSACGAGLRTIVTVNDYTRVHDFSDALLVLDKMGEPDEVFSVLQGDAKGHQYLNVALLRALDT